jgi:hypothetical protein
MWIEDLASCCVTQDEDVREEEERIAAGDGRGDLVMLEGLQKVYQGGKVMRPTKRPGAAYRSTIQNELVLNTIEGGGTWWCSRGCCRSTRGVRCEKHCGGPEAKAHAAANTRKPHQHVGGAQLAPEDKAVVPVGRSLPRYGQICVTAVGRCLSGGPPRGLAGDPPGRVLRATRVGEFA